MKPPFCLLALLLVPLCAPAVERATYHNSGGLTSLITGGQEFALRGEFMVSFEGGLTATVQPHDQRARVTRVGQDTHWKGTATYPNGRQTEFETVWTESDTGVALAGSVTSGGPDVPAPFRQPLQVDSLDYVIDLPRAQFTGWSIEPTGHVLGDVKPADPVLLRLTTNRLVFADAQHNWKLALVLDQPRSVTVTDVWQPQDQGDRRVYRVRLRVGAGSLPVGETLKFGLTLQLTGTASAAPVRLTVDPAVSRHAFDGFGGNYCFNTQTPAVDYLLDQLRHAWARFEFKATLWDLEREHPGPALLRDFELMQRAQKLGIPWVLSLWRLPERYYTDPNRQPPGTFNRQIAAERWPEFLDLLGSYLLHLRKNYGAEPDYYSFNEPDLGVDVGFTAETHRDMIRRIGAHLAALGLKTKLLLGDTANPRDSHRYVLATAADPAAMRYVGAVSFHSWGNGTPAQYRAWSDVGAWLGLPLIVGEAGTDPGSWRNRSFDSYAYGLGEMRQYQELLRDARPAALIYWQFTEDYGLVHVAADKSVTPTGRFWLMKHFTNLTPQKSTGVASSSDQPDVLVSAFVKDGAMAVHVLNHGPAREVAVAGLPAGKWRSVTTTETSGWEEAASVDVAKSLHLPARSLTTLVRDQ